MLVKRTNNTLGETPIIPEQGLLSTDQVHSIKLVLTSLM